jgi:hypothetical protein
MKEFLNLIVVNLLDLLRSFREFVLRLIEDFRRSDKYFKYKTAVIVGYAVIAILTLVIFIPGGELNQINAEVTLGKGEIFRDRYFLVSNLSTSEWKDIILNINKTYTTRHTSLGAGKKMSFPFSSFSDSQGHKLDSKIVLRNLRIECNQGVFERDFTKHP